MKIKDTSAWDPNSNRYSRREAMTYLDRLLAALGLNFVEFNFEAARFDLSPEKWLEDRLRELGWVKTTAVPLEQMEQELRQVAAEVKRPLPASIVAIQRKKG